MVVKVTVYVEGTDGHPLGRGYDQVWSTVRKEGTANQLISHFLESANQIAARLKDDSSNVKEESIVSHFLAEVGAVTIEVLPRPSVCTEAKELPEDKTITSQTVQNTDSPTDSPEIVNQQMEDDVSLDVTDKPGNSSIGVEPGGCNSTISDDLSDYVPDGNASDTGDSYYDIEFPMAKASKRSTTRSSRKKSPLKGIIPEAITDSAERDNRACDAIKKSRVIKRKEQLPERFFYSQIDNHAQSVASTVRASDPSEDILTSPTNSKPTCPKCGKEFDNISKARVHFLKKCPKISLECELCGNSFTSISGYKVHVATHKNKQEGKVFRCQTCGKVMHHRYTLAQHEATHTYNFVCDFCGKSFSQNCLLERHRNKHTREKVFACTECPKVYYVKSRLNRHVADIHEGSRELLACHICGKIVQKNNMNMHVTYLHSAVETVQCPMCSIVLKRKSYLDYHIKEIHQGGSQFHCTWQDCGKMFTRKKNLKSHMDMHNNVRRFSCQICFKKFRSSNHLLTHTNWHNGIRSHKCIMCDKSFLTRGNLTKHLATHNKNKIDQ